MKCTTIHYINSAISKSVKDLLEQHIPALVETCRAAQCFARILGPEEITYHVQTRGSVFENDLMDTVLQPVLQEVQRTRKTTVLFPYRTYPHRIANPNFDPIQYLAVFPVQYADTWIGSMGIAFFSEGMALTAAEIVLLEEVIAIYARLIWECNSVSFSFPETGVWIYNLETDELLLGDNLCHIYGIASEYSTIILPFAEYIAKFVDPEEKETVQRLKTNMLLEDMKAVEAQYRIVRSDGTIRHIWTQGLSVQQVENHKEIYGFSRDITAQIEIEEERKQYEKKIEHMAYYDHLTQLPNRRFLVKWLRQEMVLAKQGKTAGIIFFVDTDNLKVINNAYGYRYGDQVIVLTGACIVEVLGPKAFVSRISSDEFFAVLPGIYTQDQVRDIAERLRFALKETRNILGASLRLTASIGIAEYPKDGDTPEEISKNIDDAMHVAKAEGKGQYRLYGPEMKQAALKKIELIRSVYDALDKKEFF